MLNRRRTSRILRSTVALWIGFAFATTNEDPDGPLPRVRDQRPEPELIRVPSAEQALQYADLLMVAEVSLREDSRSPLSVAWVISNRMLKRGASALEVVTARGQFGTRLESGRWLSSWPLTPTWRQQNERHVERATTLARLALDRVGRDPTRGATHFHRVDSWTPPWAPDPARWLRSGGHWYYLPIRPNTSNGSKLEM